MDLVRKAKDKANEAAHKAAAHGATAVKAAKNKGEAAVKSALWDAGGDSKTLETLGAVNIEWDWSKEPKVKLGHEMKEKHFNMPDGVLFNSGSYGVTPICVLKARHEWEMKAQQDTVKFRFITCPIRLPHVANRLAYRIGADPNNLAVMTNANQATSTVFKSLAWGKGDKILLFSCDYHATTLAAEWIAERHGVEIETVDMPLPATDEQILDRVSAKLAALKDSGDLARVKLCNFCHVTSKTAFRFPARRLTQMLQSHGVPVCIDGAQAAGHIDLNIATIGCEYYIGTVHKWMYSCQGMAFLVAREAVQPLLTTLTVSYFKGAGFEKEFEYTGLMDFTGWISFIQADEFVDKVCGGWGPVRKYCSGLAKEAVALLEAKWGTKVVQGDPNYYGNMPIMPVPGAETASPGDAGKLMAYLIAKGFTCLALWEEWGEGAGKKGALCIRFAVNIYHEISDFERVGDVVAKLGGSYDALPMVAELAGMTGAGNGC